MSTEKLKFKLGVSGTFWDKRPHYTVFVDDVIVADQHIGGHSNEVEFVEFTHELTEGAHSLKIRLENKSERDTETDGHGNILNDMLLNIESIEIDDIDIGELKWSASEFTADTPKIINDTDMTVMKKCVNLGWNGAYVISFESPFYLWLLENM